MKPIRILQVLGVAAVLLRTGLDDAAKRHVAGQFAALGSNFVIAAPGSRTTSGAGMAADAATRDLPLDDCEAILHRAPSVKRVAFVPVGTALRAAGLDPVEALRAE
jgi:putative ABC transport system permease protein